MLSSNLCRSFSGGIQKKAFLICDGSVRKTRVWYAFREKRETETEEEEFKRKFIRQERHCEPVACTPGPSLTTLFSLKDTTGAHILRLL